MTRVRTYQIPIEERRKIVYIPELLKVYLVNDEIDIPEYLIDEDYIPSEPSRPILRFPRCDLILNNFCNLRCIYCYSSAGEHQRKEMPLAAAEKAIDRVASDCQITGLKRFGVTLTGGGEPLLSHKLVESIVEYCRRKREETGLACKLAIVSNGNFSAQTCKFVTDNFNNVSISVDGLPDLHDRHRPTATGKGSFAPLERNVDRLLSSGKIDVGFRMTISEINVERLSEALVFLHRKWPGVVIGLEPIEKVGRCADKNTIALDPMKFVKHFIKALRIAKKYGIQIRHSLATLKPLINEISFCGVNGKIFAIDPEGNITSCTRVNSSCDPLAQYFHYGKYDPECDQLVIDINAYLYLRNLTVNSVPGCKDCFAQYSCKGDCCHLKAGVFGKNFAHKKSPKCHANRLLIIELLRMEMGLPAGEI